MLNSLRLVVTCAKNGTLLRAASQRWGWGAEKAKFEEASNYTDIDQLGIAPQCGFASTEEGNEITFDDQRRKLELVVKTAEDIWGGV